MIELLYNGLPVLLVSAVLIVGAGLGAGALAIWLLNKAFPVR